jgi:hypothetical protein
MHAARRRQERTLRGLVARFLLAGLTYAALGCAALWLASLLGIWGCEGRLEWPPGAGEDARRTAPYQSWGIELWHGELAICTITHNVPTQSAVDDSWGFAVPGFSFTDRGDFRNPDVFGLAWPGYNIDVALWLPAVLLAVLPVTAVVRAATRRRRVPEGCPNCGYDLTGNVSGRCPECGTTVQPVTR